MQTCNVCCQDYEDGDGSYSCPFCAVYSSLTGQPQTIITNIPPLELKQPTQSACQHEKSETLIDRKAFCKKCGAWQSEWPVPATPDCMEYD